MVPSQKDDALGAGIRFLSFIMEALGVEPGISCMLSTGSTTELSPHPER